MAALGKFANFAALLSLFLLITQDGNSEDTPEAPNCRCTDIYDSRASFHDISCQGINTPEAVSCAADFLANASAADPDFRMTFALSASALQEFPSDFLEPYSVLGLVLDACKGPRIPKWLISPVCYTLTTLQIRHGVIKRIPASGLPDCSMLSSLLVQNSSVRTVAVGAFRSLVNLQELDLRQNRLQNFSGFSGIESLKMLNLAFNRLEHIAKDAFQSTPLLNTVFLNNNCLEALDPDAFASLPELQYLDLSGNRLQSFNGFSGLSNLRMLNLSSNSIAFVASDAFRELDSLWMIYLDHNNVSTLFEGTFDPLGENQDFALVSLEGNPWHCNCSLQWLQRWFTEHSKVQGKESTECFSPVHGSLMTLDLCSPPTTAEAFTESTERSEPIVTTTAPLTTRPRTTTSQTSLPKVNKTLSTHGAHSKPSNAPMTTKRTFELVGIMGISISLLYSSYMST